MSVSSRTVAQRLESRGHPAPVYRVGDLVVSTAKIPADPYPVFPPANAVIEQIVKVKSSRRRDRFGHVETTRHPNRVLIRILSGASNHTAHTGKTYWVDEDTLERP